MALLVAGKEAAGPETIQVYMVNSKMGSPFECGFALVNHCECVEENHFVNKIGERSQLRPCLGIFAADGS